jgi:tripartite-type tricarboxylate transporter receptor subunit TctC
MPEASETTLPQNAASAYRGAIERCIGQTTGTPDAIIQRLSGMLPDCLSDAVLHERMTSLGVELARPPQTTPENFTTFLRADLERTRRAVQLAGLKPE